METKRLRFQGVWNIIRFNWHFYITASAALLVLFCLGTYQDGMLRNLFYGFGILMGLPIILSLVTSFYIYDFSNLYHFDWLLKYATREKKKILFIHAGFDEMSSLIQSEFPNSLVVHADFYDPVQHTEVSIKRARKAYPPSAGTVWQDTQNMRLMDAPFDYIFVLLAAHEIRQSDQRSIFFKEQKKLLEARGKIFVLEHLRDLPNFMAFNIGFFHFFSRNSWLTTFHQAGLVLEQEVKQTPFISLFTLVKK